MQKRFDEDRLLVFALFALYVRYAKNTFTQRHWKFRFCNLNLFKILLQSWGVSNINHITPSRYVTASTPAVNDGGESIINREYLRETDNKIERFLDYIVIVCVRVYMELKKNILYIKIMEIIGRKHILLRKRALSLQLFCILLKQK